MADHTGAERQRRYREHKAGRHHLCDPARCDGAAVTASPDASPVTPDDPRRPIGLRHRGRRLWSDLLGDDDPPEVVTLVEEICRSADRLDRLDAILGGRDRAWLVLELDDAAELTLTVDKLLGETRQQQTTLRGLLAELRAAKTGAGRPASGRRPETPTGAGVTGVADLAARIAARRATAAG